ncbi:tyrosine-type recombinase/integrase [Deinococcus humi]|uniref:Integrase n=1 Tax=Deinococcus humi TaxID=662880 RepID=A0A7W8JX41_9DEIO|nr:tyrosine-type recombinase/integrase [Deinococcus humi]MBB5363528.1 integrase [Deinococcus humi]GGO30362.1 hypothetical protein GCM10008949_25150 [Deinococcus humi]
MLRAWKEGQARQRARRQCKGEPCRKGDFAFTRPDDAPPNPDSLRKLFHKLCDKSGVRTSTIHGLRHTYVTMMADLGVSIDIIARLVGRKNSDITRDVYRHLFEGKRRSSPCRPCSGTATGNSSMEQR